MKPQDVALWIGLASSIGGVAVGYGTLNEKVAQLELSTDATHLESRLTKLETRIEDNDIGQIGTEIEQLRGEVKIVADKVSGLDQASIRVLEEKVSGLKEEIRRLKNKPENPLL